MFDFFIKPLLGAIVIGAALIGAGFEEGKQSITPEPQKCQACSSLGKYRQDLGLFACDFCNIQFLKSKLESLSLNK